MLASALLILFILNYPLFRQEKSFEFRHLVVKSSNKITNLQNNQKSIKKGAYTELSAVATSAEHILKYVYPVVGLLFARGQ